MPASRVKQEQKNQIPVVTYFIIFILGFLTGVGFTIYKTSGAVPDAANAVSQQSTSNEGEENRQAILKLEAQVTANPGNFQSWRELGNLYFDTNQPEKAIGAYSKSLELHSGDANILTDLGIMYRRTGQPQKAIEFFNMAMQMDPAHEQSRFNKGIVLLHDLNKPDEAVASWEELLRINPQASTANGESIRNLVDNVKAQSGVK